jgi:hypothetical protein
MFKLLRKVIIGLAALILGATLYYFLASAAIAVKQRHLIENPQLKAKEEFRIQQEIAAKPGYGTD